MIASLAGLFRIRLALMNGVAAAAGYLLYPTATDPLALLGAVVGVALSAAAGSALNQVLERRRDALMERTRNRPLPAGRLSAPPAVAVAAVCLAGGIWILSVAGGALPALLALAVLAWYLAVYTPLKRLTSLALALGAACGAVPPVIGWCVAGGSPGDFGIVLLAGVLYLWQVPHFWLLQRRHADDYRRAGFAVFAPAVAKGALAPICRLWIAAMVAGALLLPAFGLVQVAPPLWCAAFCVPLVAALWSRCEPALFACLNLFPVLVTLSLGAGR